MLEANDSKSRCVNVYSLGGRDEPEIHEIGIADFSWKAIVTTYSTLQRRSDAYRIGSRRKRYFSTRHTMISTVSTIRKRSIISRMLY